jgi:hypothetical protein
MATCTRKYTIGDLLDLEILILYQALGMLFLNLGLDCVFNALLLLGIMLSSPLFVSIGSLLTVPASIVSFYYKLQLDNSVIYQIG